MKSFFKIFTLTALIFCLSLPTTFAEQKIIEATGSYLVSEIETSETATERARSIALRNACEKAGVYLKSVNPKLGNDESIVVASSILKIIDEKISKEITEINEKPIIKITVNIKAMIDTQDLRGE